MTWTRFSPTPLFLALFVCAAVAACSGSKGSASKVPRNAGGTGRLIAATYIGDPGETGAHQNQSPRNAIWSRRGDLIVAGLGGKDAPVTAGAYQTTYGGDRESQGRPGAELGGDCWIGRFKDDLSELTAATYFGGGGSERPCYGLDELPDGRIAVAGSTMSTSGIAAPGGLVTVKPKTNLSSGFAAVLSADLKTRMAGTYLGGDADATIRGGCRALRNGDVVAFGQIDGPGMSTPGVVQPEPAGGGNEAWIGALSADMKTLRWGTYLGSGASPKTEVVMGVQEVDNDLLIYSMSPGTAWLTQVRTSGALPAGEDATRPYVARLSGDGTKLKWVTVLGPAEGAPITGTAWSEAGLARDASGNIYVAGETDTDIGTEGTLGTRLQGPADCFVCKVSAEGKLQWCTHAGGAGSDYCIAPVVDRNGNVMVVGTTSDPHYCDRAKRTYNTAHAGGDDAFVAVLSPDGKRMEWCTLLGGSGDEVGRMTAIRASDGRVAITGMTKSDDFPVTAGAFDTTHNGNEDMFVALFEGVPMR